MAAALKFGGEEDLNDALGHIFADHAGTHGEHIGVVVAAGHLRAQRLAAQRTADAPDLVGGELITLGSDAHTPEYISCAMEARQELLKDCGLRYFATYDRKKPIFHKI